MKHLIRIAALLLSLAIAADPPTASAISLFQQTVPFTLTSSPENLKAVELFREQVIIAPVLNFFLHAFSRATTARKARAAKTRLIPRKTTLSYRQKTVIALVLTMMQPFAATARSLHPPRKAHPSAMTQKRPRTRKAPNAQNAMSPTAPPLQLTPPAMPTSSPTPASEPKIEFSIAQKRLRNDLNRYFDEKSVALKKLGQDVLIQAHLNSDFQLQGTVDPKVDPYGTMPERRLRDLETILKVDFALIDSRTLPTYIQHIQEPTIRQALFFISTFNAELYRALEVRGVPIDFFKIEPGYERDPEVRSTRGATSGTTFDGRAGDPSILLTPETEGFPVHMAITLVHEGLHARELPDGFWSLYWDSFKGLSGLWDLIRWLVTGLPRNEGLAFGIESSFLEKVLRIHLNEDISLRLYFDETIDAIKSSFEAWLPLYVAVWLFRLIRRWWQRRADITHELVAEYVFRRYVFRLCFGTLAGLYVYAAFQLATANSVIRGLLSVGPLIILPMMLSIFVLFGIANLSNHIQAFFFAAFHRHEWGVAFGNRFQAGIYLRKLWSKGQDGRERAIWLHDLNNRIMDAGGDIHSQRLEDPNQRTFVNAWDLLDDYERALIGHYYWGPKRKAPEIEVTASTDLVSLRKILLHPKTTIPQATIVLNELGRRARQQGDLAAFYLLGKIMRGRSYNPGETVRRLAGTLYRNVKPLLDTLKTQAANEALRNRISIADQERIITRMRAASPDTLRSWLIMASGNPKSAAEDERLSLAAHVIHVQSTHMTDLNRMSDWKSRRRVIVPRDLFYPFLNVLYTIDTAEQFLSILQANRKANDTELKVSFDQWMWEHGIGRQEFEWMTKYLRDKHEMTGPGIAEWAILLVEQFSSNPEPQSPFYPVAKNRLELWLSKLKEADVRVKVTDALVGQLTYLPESGGVQLVIFPNNTFDRRATPPMLIIDNDLWSSSGWETGSIRVGDRSTLKAMYRPARTHSIVHRRTEQAA